MAFVGPRPEKLKHFACHLNDDPWDNRLVNLVWGTQSTNERHKKENKLLRRSLESAYVWYRSYQLTDEAIYSIWESNEDDMSLGWEHRVPRETIWLIKRNLAVIAVPTDKPEALVRYDDRLMKNLPF